MPHPLYPIQRHGPVAQPTCSHDFVDALNLCLDCGIFVPSRAEHVDDICIYCCSMPTSETWYPYCSAFCAIEAGV